MGTPELPDSFERRFTELFNLALRPAWRLLGDRQEAENVAAEALARALVRWRTLHASPTLPGWIVTVSTNLAIGHLRRTRRPPVGVMMRVHDPALIDDRIDLNDAMSTLSIRQRQALAMRYFFDFSEADIAGALGISVSSVKTHLQRGLQALRRRFEEPREATVGVE
jgi:RNA polymerase sigma factor (sigma-70 family)